MIFLTLFSHCSLQNKMTKHTISYLTRRELQKQSSVKLSNKYWVNFTWQQEHNSVHCVIKYHSSHIHNSSNIQLGTWSCCCLQENRMIIKRKAVWILNWKGLQKYKLLDTFSVSHAQFVYFVNVKKNYTP